MERSSVYGTEDSRFDSWWGYMTKENCSDMPDNEKRAFDKAVKKVSGQSSTGKNAMKSVPRKKGK